MSRLKFSKTTDSECLFKIPFHLIFTDASKIRFLQGYSATKKYLGQVELFTFIVVYPSCGELNCF